jgi:hypothetical protein
MQIFVFAFSHRSFCRLISVLRFSELKNILVLIEHINISPQMQTCWAQQVDHFRVGTILLVLFNWCDLEWRHSWHLQVGEPGEIKKMMLLLSFEAQLIGSLFQENSPFSCFWDLSVENVKMKKEKENLHLWMLICQELYIYIIVPDAHSNPDFRTWISQIRQCS